MTDEAFKLKEDLYKAKNEASKLRRLLNSLFDGLETFILAFRVLIYIGSVGLAWFYLNDRTLAVGIVAALTCAHLLIYFREYLAELKKELSGG